MTGDPGVRGPEVAAETDRRASRAAGRGGAISPPSPRARRPPQRCAVAGAGGWVRYRSVGAERADGHAPSVHDGWTRRTRLGGRRTQVTHAHGADPRRVPHSARPRGARDPRAASLFAARALRSTPPRAPASSADACRPGVHSPLFHVRFGETGPAGSLLTRPPAGPGKALRTATVPSPAPSLSDGDDECHAGLD